MKKEIARDAGLSRITRDIMSHGSLILAKLCLLVLAIYDTLLWSLLMSRSI